MSDNKSVLHGFYRNPEFTACGLLFDAYEVGDHDEPVKFARSGQKVTCEDCIREIRFFKTAYGSTYKYYGAKHT
ncbi:MAG: hypothetical protein CMF04_08925 [Hyphomonas sp.]|nr:hypothetical protein [Hyphomonas sp.]